MAPGCAGRGACDTQTPCEYLEKPRLLEIERDLRYVRARLEGAVVVDSTAQPRDEVHFGATVTTRDESGQLRDFALVGEDEADAAQGLISWRSPLASTLLGARVGDAVRWQRPAGATELEIVKIRYR
ncbi:MAG: transcription elongation factor GreB [Betaproteobacteria bacterium]|nr:transcription elongation factor GreB [Betaproteobacteria bacterium]